MLQESLRAWSDARAYQGRALKDKPITFYADNAASYDHYERVIYGLTIAYNRRVCYLTSDADDPLLDTPYPNLQVYYIGRGKICENVFAKMCTGVLVTTKPGLETRDLTRSKSHPVHYVYMFHSLLSTHMAYREDDFDHYDTILCAGPHQMAELKIGAQLRDRKPPRLIEHGYGKIDAMLERRRATQDPVPGRQHHVLIATGAGPNGLLELHGAEIVRQLLKSGFRVTVRPHPSVLRTSPQTLKALHREFDSAPHFAVYPDPRGFLTLVNADVLISDGSAIAFDFALGMEKPVLTFDMPRRVSNPNCTRYPRHPIESALRERIGIVMPPARMRDLPDRVAQLCSTAPRYREALAQLRTELMFNPGISGSVGATAIESLSIGVDPERALSEALEQLRANAL
ncbi:MAG: hypothetical protein ACKVX7_15805 [Planctomycetota bacterium]